MAEPLAPRGDLVFLADDRTRFRAWLPAVSFVDETFAGRGIVPSASPFPQHG